MVEIQNNIRQYRTEIDLTQEELAEKLGVTRQTIIAIEKGNYKPSLELAYKIAKIFNKTIENIFIFKK